MTGLLRRHSPPRNDTFLLRASQSVQAPVVVTLYS